MTETIAPNSLPATRRNRRAGSGYPGWTDDGHLERFACAAGAGAGPGGRATRALVLQGDLSRVPAGRPALTAARGGVSGDGRGDRPGPGGSARPLRRALRLVVCLDTGSPAVRRPRRLREPGG